MRRVILIMSGLLLTTMLQAQSWQPKPWQKYLIGEQVKKESISSCQSVMGNVVAPTPYEPRLFRTVTSSSFIKDIPPYKKKSKSFFGNNDTSRSLADERYEREKAERIACGDYSTSDFIVDMVFDLIDTFLFKNK
ncbi:hypothetical protein J5A56_08205 [Prevotella melaninogenica]|uniref:hypothetical protein n=2 Tax=Prevotella TaxID=838 RepID=UPI0003ACEFC8|nr:hypothetical protein [Prevotella sp. F0091]ERJ77247.1 hypothetical protein HMPREF9148_01356 [Prevotella sp. F0091]QUB74415.1 hypothetical protein J5A56_08205 [Prevotella melaninogenica]